MGKTLVKFALMGNSALFRFAIANYDGGMMQESEDENMEMEHERDGSMPYDEQSEECEIDSLPALPDAEVLERIRDEKKRGMFVSGWEEDDEGIAEKNLDDPAEQMLTAAETGDVKLLVELYQRDRSLLEVRDSDDYTPLHRAAYNNHIDAVRYLLSIGADPELKTENGWTVIHCAAFWACYNIVAILLSHGVDVNSKTNGNLTPLHLAINSNGDSENIFHTVRYLLEAPGIDASAVSNAGDTPIMLARRTSPKVYEIIERRNDPQRWSTRCLVNEGDKQNFSRGKYCMECDRMAPLRSHHCQLCQMCVLRKDHHCFMTGGCVGIANQRYFIVFVLWAGVGCALGSYYLLMYLITFVETNLYPFGWIKFVAPFAIGRWLASYETFTNMFMCIVFSISVSTSVAAFIFFFSQMFFTLNGYTMYDYNTLRRRIELKGDGNTYTERLQLVFGRNWLLNFIFPQFWHVNRLTADIARNIFNTSAKDV
ncbi:unnamed protein product [Anisakis simplex]|uniref:Palmitoyltransferase n=1 Tax=Anisakis simplex TaxID=6269 RepID=A0A0M3K799_ANISI|nr:unnamed protein product [Anisakis simplex]